jgi:tagatose 1,6-diphosphate aldolase GatY/KbaY
MLVTSEKLLKDAAAGGYAVGAFNVENADMLWGVIRAAEECCSPVIVQTTPGTLRYMPPAWFAGMVCGAAAEATVPVALHLDHGDSAAMAETCLNAGYTSLMIDGSALGEAENTALTKLVCDLARGRGVPVEGELGVIGGKEDSTEAEGPVYTDPEAAARFAAATGVSSLAIAVGTAHGFYAKTPALNLDIARETRGFTATPLVLHGASGLSDEVIAQAVRAGFAKVNFATELRAAYSDAVKVYLRERPEAYDPKAYGAAGREAVKALVIQKIRVCGCAGRAYLDSSPSVITMSPA